MRIKILSTILLFAIVYTSIIAGIHTERRKTREKLNTCKYAPTPIMIGDTLYLTRVYPMNLTNIPKEQ